MDRCALVRAARGVPADKIVVHMPVTFDTRLFSPSLAASLREIRQSRLGRRLRIAARGVFTNTADRRRLLELQRNCSCREPLCECGFSLLLLRITNYVPNWEITFCVPGDVKLFWPGVVMTITTSIMVCWALPM